MSQMEQPSPSRRSVWFVTAWCLILGGFVANQIYLVPNSWTNARGYEYFWIAESIAAGEGFSFPRSNRWLFQLEQNDPDMPDYGPTAWKEPVYPYLLGWSMRLLGNDAGKVLIVGLQLLALLVIVALTGLIGKQFAGPWAGTIAAGLVAISPGVHREVGTFGTPIFGALIILLLLILLWRCMDRPSLRRAVQLGLVLGVGGLTLAPTLMLGPVTACAMSIEAIRRRSWKPVMLVAVVALVSFAVISPWTIRNARTFDKFILVQTGLGNFASFSNVYAAETFMPELALDPKGSGPPWRSSGPWEAVWRMCHSNDERDLAKRSRTTVAADPPTGWRTMSEPQRDAVYMGQFKAFVTEHPLVFAQLALCKGLVLFFARPVVLLPLNIIALFGAVLLVRRPRGYTVLLSLAFLAIPTMVTAPLFYRYRMPLEPLIAILAAVAVASVIERILALRRDEHAHRTFASRAGSP